MELRTWFRRAPFPVLLLAIWSSACSEDTGERLLGPLVATASPQGEQPEASDPLAGTETVLLVDDQKEVRLLARSALTRKGYTVLEAGNGADALEIAAGPEQIDLLLAEVATPDMSGLELSEALAESEPQLKVLFMADSTEVSSVPASVRLEKPFTRDGLLTRVREVLGS